MRSFRRNQDCNQVAKNSFWLVGCCHRPGLAYRVLSEAICQPRRPDISCSSCCCSSVVQSKVRRQSEACHMGLRHGLKVVWPQLVHTRSRGHTKTVHDPHGPWRSGQPGRRRSNWLDPVEPQLFIDSIWSRNPLWLLHRGGAGLWQIREATVPWYSDFLHRWSQQM